MKETENYFTKALEAVAQIAKKAPMEENAAAKKYDAAVKDYEKARALVEVSATEEEFNAAIEEEREARSRLDFYKKQLDKVLFSPKLDEAAYDNIVEGIDKTVERAGQEFSKEVGEAMERIIAATKKYKATTLEADAALGALDKAANVLQTRYRYRAVTRKNRPVEYIEDPLEWKRHRSTYSLNSFLSKGATYGLTDDRIKAACRAATPFLNK